MLSIVETNDRVSPNAQKMSTHTLQCANKCPGFHTVMTGLLTIMDKSCPHFHKCMSHFNDRDLLSSPQTLNNIMAKLCTTPTEQCTCAV